MTVPYPQLTDEQLLEVMRDGNQKAFNELYRRYQALLYAYAFKLTADDMQTQDIVQETFMTLWDSRERISITHSVSAYLYSAVRYRFYRLAATDRLRHDLAEALLQAVNTVSPTTDAAMFHRELLVLVARIAEQLPGNMGQIFIMSRLEKLSNQEIADALELSEKTVRNQLSQAGKKMREKLKPLRNNDKLLTTVPLVSVWLDRFFD
ncbi:RNA polymerase sigma factor [Parapedobacter tibetensis]|uniref:RNA polymerase sigma factor n=1 Tax=Parapedobacter tibetensis TaxID=2972951 RepID=UPI00214D1CC2|nr:RNA polymerase sigma-70 factor [Parapedobacter tibetensis]